MGEVRDFDGRGPHVRRGLHVVRRHLVNRHVRQLRDGQTKRVPPVAGEPRVQRRRVDGVCTPGQPRFSQRQGHLDEGYVGCGGTWGPLVRAVPRGVERHRVGAHEWLVQVERVVWSAALGGDDGTGGLVEDLVDERGVRVGAAGDLRGGECVRRGDDAGHGIRLDDAGDVHFEHRCRWVRVRVDGLVQSVGLLPREHGDGARGRWLEVEVQAFG